MHPRTQAKALDALEGMAGIVRREMLVRGTYVESVVSNPRLTDALCGGRKHCAIGSLWAGAGFRAEVRDYPELALVSVELPGTDEDERTDFVRHRAGLRAALAALNTAALAFAARRDLVIAEHWNDPIEGLFESHYGDDLTKRDLLRVIKNAKQIVLAS